MIGYDVYCYRCRVQENGRGGSEDAARGAIEDFKQRHRSSCGTGASFSVSTYSAEPVDTLLGVVDPPSYENVEGLADDGTPL